MKSRKKILSILIKLFIGLGSFIIIYFRLRHEFTAQKLDLLGSAALSARGFGCVALCILLMPLNWGMESYKWLVVTKPIQNIGYRRAMHSVYSGVCLGNFAPARATEFVAKILYFDNANRPRVVVLHFINGMFQFSVTAIVGFAALFLRLGNSSGDFGWLVYLSAGAGMMVIGALAASIYKIDYILNFVTSKLARKNNVDSFDYQFKAITVFTLFGFSLLRYLVFTTQFALLLFIFMPHLTVTAITGTSLYFFITAATPMLSVVEAAIRTAVALLAFKGLGINDTAIALATVLLWLVNIIVPSIIGYYFLLQQNFNFKFRRAKT